MSSLERREFLQVLAAASVADIVKSLRVKQPQVTPPQATPPSSAPPRVALAPIGPAVRRPARRPVPLADDRPGRWRAPRR